MSKTPLKIINYKSCQVILHHKTDLALCNRANCPLYKKIRCNRCDYRVLFHDKEDRKIVKAALSMAGFFYHQYIKSAQYNNYGSYAKIRDDKCRDLKTRIDLYTRTMMYKILMNMHLKYKEGIATVDTYESNDFATRIKLLAHVFLPAKKTTFKYSPKIIEN